MAEFGVGFKLYADSAQFQREMKQAVQSAKNVQQGLKDIGLNIGGLLGVGAIANAFFETARAAQSLRDEAEKVGASIDAGTASAARFGDSIDGIKKALSGVAVSTLGTFTKIGEEIGDMFLWVFEGQSMQAIEANAKISKEAEKNIAAIAKANENRAQKLLEADEKLAKAQRDNAIKRAGDEDKLNALLAEQARIQEEINKTGKNTVKARELQIESENNITEIVKERDRIAKKAIEEQEKADKEMAKAKADLAERQNKAQEKLNELRFKGLSTEEQINELTKKKTELEAAVFALKENGISATEVEMMLQEAQNELAEKRLKLEESIAKTREKAAEKAKQDADVAAALSKATGAGLTGDEKAALETWIRGGRKGPAPNISREGIIGIRGGQQFSQSTDEALRELIAQNRALAQQITNPALGGGRFNRGEAARLEFEARNAESEIRFRESLRRDVQMFGEEGARRNFKGDPLKFDALLQQYVTDARSLQEIQKESTSELKDLNARLSKFGFTK